MHSMHRINIKKYTNKCKSKYILIIHAVTPARARRAKRAPALHHIPRGSPCAHLPDITFAAFLFNSIFAETLEDSCRFRSRRARARNEVSAALAAYDA